MIEGRGRDLDLSACRELAVDGNDLAATSICFRPSICWSSRVKSRPLRTRPDDVGVFLQELLVEPGELRQHLQIAERLAVQQSARARRDSVPDECHRSNNSP